MKTKYILLPALIAVFSSCSTAYRSGQTPDDVYYSPAPAEKTYVSSYNQQDRDSYSYQNEDQEIRRGIQDSRYRGSSGVTLNLGYGYNPYMNNMFGYPYSPYSLNPYSYNPYAYNPYAYKGIYDPYGYNSYGYNNFGYGGYYNSPYYGGYYPPVYVYPGIGSVKANTNTGPRKVNLGAYNNSSNSNNSRMAPRGNMRVSSNGTSNSNSAPVRSFQQRESRETGVGNVIRRVFTPSNERSYTPPSSSSRSSGNNRSYNNNRSSNRSYDNSRNNTNTTPSRSFNNTPASSSPSSGNNSGGSGSAPVRTFRR